MCYDVEVAIVAQLRTVDIKIKYASVAQLGTVASARSDEASNKEWQRSKFCAANSKQKISGTATGRAADCCGRFPFGFKDQ